MISTSKTAWGFCFFFFQAEDGIRDDLVTGVQTCALPIYLGWSEEDNGGSAITQYRILRGTAPGSETFLAAVGGNQTRYDDTTATNTAVTYYYKVTATNAVGTSCGDNEVSARYVGNSDTGFTLAADPTGDKKAAPGNADLDVQS